MIFDIFQMFPGCFQITSRTTGDEFEVKKRVPSSTRPPRGGMVDGSPRAQHIFKIWAKVFSKLNFSEPKASPDFSSGPTGATNVSIVSSYSQPNWSELEATYPGVTYSFLGLHVKKAAFLHTFRQFFNILRPASQ